MKSIFMPFITTLCLASAPLVAQCQDGCGGHAAAGGYYGNQGCGCGTFGLDRHSCDFASSLWAGYCEGGPHCASHGCGGCGGHGHLRNLLSRMHGRGSGCSTSCGDSSGGAGVDCGPNAGCGGYATGFAPTAAGGRRCGHGGCPSGACAGNDTWWYGYGQPARTRGHHGSGRHAGCGGVQTCGSGDAAACGTGCGGRHGHCGFMGRLFRHGSNSCCSWVGGGPLDGYGGGIAFPESCVGCEFGACLNCNSSAVDSSQPPIPRVDYRDGTMPVQPEGDAPTDNGSPQADAYPPADKFPLDGGSTEAASNGYDAGLDYDAAESEDLPTGGDDA